jgi:putative two-component system response regulator
MTESRLDKPIILTIDDDPIILNSIRETLKQDYIVRPFTSGEAAFKYLDNNTAELILLDHNMPHMSGFEVLRTLRSDQRLKEIPVIFLTGSVVGDDEISALEMGAMDYLLKPLKPRVLLMRVRLQIELYRHRHKLGALVAEKTEQLQEINRKLKQREKTMLELLAKASDMRDHDTGMHIIRTTEYVRIIVTDLCDNPREGYFLTKEQGEELVATAKLHDIGKIAMPDAVLQKPGRLTDEEVAIIRMHPTRAADMLSDAIKGMDDTLMQVTRDIAQFHHEKWDGSGYPNGLRGTDIPLSARIVAVADVFDALTSDRPYKTAFPSRQAFDNLYNNIGKHFDPYLIEIVRRHERDFEAVMEKNK